ncbi:hypothetical protein Bca101_031375 [Brassica carinata]
MRSGGLAFKLSFWSGVEVVRCRRSSVFAWGPVRRLILHPAKSSGTLGLFLKARLLWFRLLYGCRSAVVVCDAFSFPFLRGSQRSPPLMSLRRGFIELPSVLGVSARQGRFYLYIIGLGERLRMWLSSLPVFLHLLALCSEAEHNNCDFGGLGTSSQIGALVCLIQVEVLSSGLRLLYRWWLVACDSFSPSMKSCVWSVSIFWSSALGKPISTERGLIFYQRLRTHLAMLQYRQTVDLKVRMCCTGCVRIVRKAISKLRGVDSVEVEREMGRVRVVGYVDRNKVLKAVRRAGKRAEFWPYPEPPLYFTSTQNYFVDPSKEFKESYNYYRHGYNGTEQHGNIPVGSRGDDRVSNMFNDDNVNACSVM